MERKDILEIRNIIEDIKSKGISEEYIKELYKILGNKCIPLTFNSSYKTALFSRPKKEINVDLDRCRVWTSDLVKAMSGEFSVYDPILLRAYLYIQILAHEIEHSNQVLIASGEKEVQYPFLKQVYGDIGYLLDHGKYTIFDIPSYIADSIRFNRYMKYEYQMVLERNADVMGYNTLSLIASEASDKDILNIMLFTRAINMGVGYYKSREGDIKYTYRTLGMMRKYRQLDIPTDMPLFDKIIYGVELTEEEKEKADYAFKKTLELKIKDN